MWDRRTLGKERRPIGVFVGHCDGLTHVSPKGDGRYCITNSKDQVHTHTETQTYGLSVGNILCAFYARWQTLSHTDSILIVH